MRSNLHHILLGMVVVLVVLGSLFLAILSAPFSLKKFNNTNYFLVHQLLYGLLPGIFLGIVFYKLPLSKLEKISPILVLLNLIFLVLVFLPKIGAHFWGANRWINIGNVTFQPSEFLKITSILYLGAWLKNRVNPDFKRGYLSKIRKGTYNLKKVLFPFLVFLAVIGLILALQPDISTLGIIILTSLLIYFSAKTPLWHTIFIVLIGIVALVVLIHIKPYRFSRLLVFLNPEIDPFGQGLQIKQSLIAIGSGGILGKGFGMSVQKFGFLPQPMSDTTFAVFAEETGFLGSLFLIFLFIAFFWVGKKISNNSQDKFAKLVALGITFWITIQALVNIGSMIGILPLGGIPLPFISYGGSHIMVELIGVGILLNIAKHSPS